MGGLGKLDANRMSDDDVRRRGDEEQAIYSFNIPDKEYEFSNDISQRTWEENTHLKDALNKPQKLSKIDKIGLEKTGNGTLILSGQNTYDGDTIVSGGTLKLTGSLAGSAFASQNTNFILGDEKSLKNTAKIAGNFVNDGKLIGIGTIEGDLTNSGLILAGFYSEDDVKLGQDPTLKVAGTFYQKAQNAELQLAFTKDEATKELSNSKFQAVNYDISAGKLTFVPLHNVQKLNLIQIGDKIPLKLADNFGDVLNNQALSISVKSTNLLKFQLNTATKELIAYSINDTIDPIVNTGNQPTPVTPPSSGDGGQGSGSGDNTGGGTQGASGEGGSQGTGGGSSGGNTGDSGSQGGGQGGSGSQPSNPDQGNQNQPTLVSQLSQLHQPSLASRLSQSNQAITQAIMTTKTPVTTPAQVTKTKTTKTTKTTKQSK